MPGLADLQKARIVHSVEISTIAHATDDLGKIQEALRFTLPDVLKDHEVFTRRYLEGYHSNPIVIFDAKLTRPAEIEQFTRHFVRELPKVERLKIQRDMQLHCDPEGNLYVRLDKQQAFRGKAQLGGEDPIRIKIKLNRLVGTVEELIKKVLELQ